jgi:serine/threonine protein kinase
MGELLGEGAMGTVYAATDSRGQRVAVKFLHEGLADDPEAVARFRRLPFVRQSHAAVMQAKLTARAPTLAEATGVTWPAPVEDFFRRALAREVAKRFTSAEEMRSAWIEAVAVAEVPTRAELRADEHDAADHGEDTNLDGDTATGTTDVAPEQEEGGPSSTATPRGRRR